MKKLNQEHAQAVMEYVLLEPEYNVFFIGNLENYGLESEQCSFYTAKAWAGGRFPYLVLDYGNDFLIYSHDPSYHAAEVADFLSHVPMKNLSGKRELIEPLLMYFDHLELVPTYLARLNSPTILTASGIPVRKLLAADVPAIYGVLSQIEEFFTIRSRSKEESFKKILTSLTHEGRMYGIFEGGKLAAIAGTSAENSMSAMIVSVATLPEYRRRGWATHLVTRLCQDCLNDGMKFLCLFYDNPKAGTIYQKIGFKESGQYAMVKSRE